MNSLDIIQHAFFTYLKSTFSLQEAELASIGFDINIDESKAAFGDVSSNAALVLAKLQQNNPRSIAQRIINEFQNPDIEKIEAAGPGFLNFFLKEAAFIKIAQELSEPKHVFFKLPTSIPKHNFSLEFVSANPTGPLHLGHGRGGIIGDVLGNILRFLGHHVTKEFYINDAGTQIQKLGLSLKARCLELLGIPTQMPEDGYQGGYLIDLAQECVAKYGKDLLGQPDSFFAAYAKDNLLTQIQKTLKEYGIVFDVWFSEKTLHENGSIAQALALLTKNGHTYEQDGALWFQSTAFGDDKDRVLKKSNGELTYIAADVAYIQNKINRGADRLVIVLGQDHHSYVMRLKGIMQALGYNPDHLDVILYQLVTLKESGELVRMSKRAGKIVTLKDIIETVGTDVARFFYLNRKADAHLDFDITLALKKTEENPVYYIQYAYVRTNSILAKAAQESALQRITDRDIKMLSPDDTLLIKKIVTLKTLLSNISHNYQTHLLSYYAHELAHIFHRYYSHNRIIDLENVPQSRSRLALTMLLNNTFQLCLNLLGISRPESM